MKESRVLQKEDISTYQRGGCGGLKEMIHSQKLLSTCKVPDTESSTRGWALREEGLAEPQFPPLPPKLPSHLLGVILRGICF